MVNIANKAKYTTLTRTIPSNKAEKMTDKSRVHSQNKVKPVVIFS